MSTPRRPPVPAPGSRAPRRPATSGRPTAAGRTASNPTAAPPTASNPTASNRAVPKPVTKTPPKTSPVPVARRGGSRAGEPGRLRGYLPETITTRTLVLSAVILLVFVLLVPTAREYAKQTAQLDALHAELAAAQEQKAQGEADLERWQDPAYVKAQARERLGYVMPGERAYRVIDPSDAVPDGVSPLTGQAVHPGVVQGVPGDQGAWYEKAWTSVEVAGAGVTPGG